MDDAGVLVADRKELYDSNWMAKRAARNIVTEFAGTANRLPDHFKETHPTVPWSGIRGLRNRVVHDYESTLVAGAYKRAHCYLALAAWVQAARALGVAV